MTGAKLAKATASRLATLARAGMQFGRLAGRRNNDRYGDCGHSDLLDRDNQVVGFLLAERDREALELTYACVRTSHRGNDIFPTLVKKMMAKGVPLTATVLHSNKSDMVNRLLKLGFTKDSTPSWLETDRDRLRWQP